MSYMWVYKHKFVVKVVYKHKFVVKVVGTCDGNGCMKTWLNNSELNFKS